jgi:chromate transporter
LFLRFLRFGALAWGGPVAQIDMIRHELVEQERWIDPARFHRVLAVYQALPGPEAHELCVYFGMVARGRWGGVVAGLGFMLPGFALMFALSWAYLRFGLAFEGLSAVFAAVQVAVAALVARATWRIGGHVLRDRWLWTIAAIAAAAQLVGAPFGLALGAGGLAYLLAMQRPKAAAPVLLALAAAGVGAWAWQAGGFAGLEAFGVAGADGPEAVAGGTIPLLALFASGLKAGLLTFGGAYTVIPFLQRDAVGEGAWMSNAQFLDGLALTGLLPAPLVIFSTFVGYLGGGPWGAVAMTAGVFFPAFGFTLLGHELMESLVQQPRIHAFLDGVTAAVVGLIAGTALAMARANLDGPGALALFALALLVLFASKARGAIPAVIAGAALWGWLVG